MTSPTRRTRLARSPYRLSVPFVIADVATVLRVLNGVELVVSVMAGVLAQTRVLMREPDQSPAAVPVVSDWWDGCRRR